MSASHNLETVDRGISAVYNIDKRLGKGAYGIVWRATEKSTGRTVALKKIFDAFRNVTDAQRTFREIIYLQGFAAHPNIISLLDVVKADNDKDIYLVFDHMDADLHMVNKAKLLAPVHTPHVMCQCFKALHYMHTGGVIHRDLKPSNVLMNDSAHAALADFGLARSIMSIPEANGGIDPTMTDYVATRWYRSPEILLGSTAYTYGTDIWSMGCILGEMLLGVPIFQGTSSMHQLDLISQLVGPPSPQDIAALNAPYASATFSQISTKRKKSPQQMFPKADPLALDLLMKLLRYDPSERLTTAEALQHPFLAPFMADATPMSMDMEVVTPFDDNQRLTIKDYRTKLYAEIKQQRFVRAPSPTSPPPPAQHQQQHQHSQHHPSSSSSSSAGAGAGAAWSSHRAASHHAASQPLSSAASAVPPVTTQQVPRRRTAAKPALVKSYAPSTYSPAARAPATYTPAAQPRTNVAGSGSQRAAQEDQNELDALKSLSARTPRSDYQQQQQQRENVPQASNQPSHQRQPYQAWTGGQQQSRAMPSRATGFTDMQTRVSALAADTSTQLMDIYGSSVRGGGASSAGFNKRNQSSVFASDGDATVRPQSATERGAAPARSSGGWRAGRPPVGTTNIYREHTLAQGGPRGRGVGSSRAGGANSSVPYGSLRQSQRGYATPW